jgi:glycosyltransferase involved in cell wall biosynthesis
VNPPRDLRALGALVRIVRRFRPDIVHTHTAKAGFLGRQAALIASRPAPILVHTYHGHVLEGYFGPVKSGLYRRLEHRLACSTDRLIGVSQATVDDLVRLGIAARDRFQVIPLGLDLSGYVQDRGDERLRLRNDLGLGDRDVLALFVGRVVPIKRLDRLIRAIKNARELGAPVHLAIVGDGEIRPSLERLVADGGLADAVHFLGYRRELAPVFAAADLAVLSSANEGTPVSLIEAGAAGVPAVATDVGGVAEVVTPETGVVVPACDEEALAAALGRLSGDERLRTRLGAAARERTLDRYSADRLITDIQELYDTLLQPAHAG